MVNPIGSFICAAIPSITNHFRAATKDSPEYFSDYSGINKFLHNNCNRFLSSVGLALNRRKKLEDNVFDKYLDILHYFKSYKYLKDIEVTIDSGGYQFQTGYIFKEDTIKWIDMYHKFLCDKIDEYDWSFTFDPIPGPIGTILSSYDEMEKLNIYSYEKASNLPEHVRNKILYIHHFRTPLMNKLYVKLLKEYKFADNFINFSTGGLVAFSKGMKKSPPYILYVVPLVYILNHAIKRKLKKFRFHVLGGSDFKDIFIHNLIARHIKEVHNIDIEITYDSATIIKGFAMSRDLYIVDEEQKLIDVINIRSNMINSMYENRISYKDLIYSEFNKIADQCELGRIDSDKYPLYNSDKNGSLNNMTYFYGILYILQVFNKCEKWSKETVDEIYPLYKSGNHTEFTLKVEKKLSDFNRQKTSETVQSRATSIINTFELLKTLDETHCDYLINRYLYQDECSSLIDMNDF